MNSLRPPSNNAARDWRVLAGGYSQFGGAVKLRGSEGEERGTATIHAVRSNSQVLIASECRPINYCKLEIAFLFMAMIVPEGRMFSICSSPNLERVN